MTRGLLALAITLALLGAPAAHADAPDAQAVATARHLLIALRVLSYDKRLADRSPGPAVTIALVYSPTDAGRQQRADLEAGFALIPKVKVGGRTVKVVAIEAATDKALTRSLVAAAPTAVIVADDLGERMPSLRAATRTASALSFSWRETDIASGISVGIVAGREHDQIVINLDASRAEGVRFGAGLLQLARIVDGASR